MIAIRDILIFIAGGILVYVSILTRNYLYGKRISVSGITRKEEAYKPRRVSTQMPEIDAARFETLVAKINTIDEFGGTHSRRMKTREE